VFEDCLFLWNSDEWLLLTVKGYLLLAIHYPFFFHLLEESSILIGGVAKLRKVPTSVLQLNIGPLLDWPVKI